ncbi:MAG: hypothetical protein WA001_05905 [Patescibacteria group bacterium]
MRHTVAISDIHLSQLEPSDGLWMRYRQAPFVPDKELVVMLDALRERVRGQELELILNGDIFDFDVPWIKNGKTRFPDAERDAAIGVPVMRDILHDHLAFIQALGRVLADGHTVIFISGNHDVEMTLPEIRAEVRYALLDASFAAGAKESRDAISQRILFRAWFYLTRDGILLEHGHQYDETNCYRTIMQPYDNTGKNIAPTLGALTTRYFGARLGYFNPNVDESYMLSFWGYLRHWIKYYLFSSQSILKTFFVGVAKTFINLIKDRGDVSPQRKEKNAAAAVTEAGVGRELIDKHLALAVKPVEENTFQLLSDLGLDRILLALLAVILAYLWAHFTNGWLEFGALVPLGLFALYGFFAPRRSSLEELWRHVQRATQDIAATYHAQAVIFGHTHHAEGTWENGIFYGNTGSWSAAYKDIECTIPLTDKRPIIWLTTQDGTSALQGGLLFWKDGKFLENQDVGA